MYLVTFYGWSCVPAWTCVAAVATSEQGVRSYVAECQPNDWGLVQVSSNGGLQWQKTRQVAKHVGFHLAPLPGCLAADGPAGARGHRPQARTNTSDLSEVWNGFQDLFCWSCSNIFINWKNREVQLSENSYDTNTCLFTVFSILLQLADSEPVN